MAGGALLLVKALEYGIDAGSKRAAAIQLTALVLIVAGSAVNLVAIKARGRERAAGYTTIAWPKRAARGLWLLASNGQVARPPTQ